MARKLLTVLMTLALLGPLSAISGCNTVSGAGKDIERGGEKIQDGTLPDPTTDRNMKTARNR